MIRENFTSIMKVTIYKKYNFTCQKCRKEWNGKERLFHIHHIDNNSKNNKIDNLILLCHSCHIGNGIIKDCPNCKKEYHIPQSYIDANRGKFCSRKCYLKFLFNRYKQN